MLDLGFVKENIKRVKRAIKYKKVSGVSPEDIDRLVTLSDEIKQLKRQIQDLRTLRNRLAQQIKGAKKQESLNKAAKLREDIKSLELTLKEKEEEFNRIYQLIPNVFSKDTPIGDSEEDNVVIRIVGSKPKFDFKPKTHYELFRNLGIADFERGVKVAGFRGYFLLGDLAMLHWAVLTFAFAELVKKGFIPVIPPTVVKEFVMFGAGQFPWGKEDTFKLANPHTHEDYYLIGTAEQPLMALLANEIISEEKLPLKLVGFSPSYRREVGAHHKDLKGLIRLHEFWKVEQVVIIPPDERLAYDIHEEITQNAEELLQKLGIHYRVLAMCSADMGNPHYKKYDIESWMPGQGKYRETHSSSIMSDFQCRRNNIRVKLKTGKKAFAWSLNNTAIASPRILAVIAENYQTHDGRVKIPEVLVPYMFGKRYIEPVQI